MVYAGLEDKIRRACRIVDASFLGKKAYILTPRPNSVLLKLPEVYDFTLVVNVSMLDPLDYRGIYRYISDIQYRDAKTGAPQPIREIEVMLFNYRADQERGDGYTTWTISTGGDPEITEEFLFKVLSRNPYVLDHIS